MDFTPTKVPMYFASLEIENVKCFGEKQPLDLTNEDGTISRWTLILGNNGVGKTTLLKTLAWMVPVELTERENDTDVAQPLENSSDERPQKVVKMKPFMDGFEDEEEYERLFKIGKTNFSRITATFSNGVLLKDVPKSTDLVSHGIKLNIDERGKLKGEIEVESGELPTFNSPNLFAYSASRHMAFKNYDKSELKDHVSNLFSDSGDLYDAEQLLTILDNAAVRTNYEGKAAELLKKVKRILSDLLPDVDSPDCIIINSPLKPDGSANEILVEVKTPYGNVPLFNLSLGYKTMLAWVVDLAIRMLWCNPESDSPLEEPAVVIVDEIDLHLHPSWQRIIRSYLTEHFTNTQFICTAHSPIMAQASETENLCVLNKINDEVHINSNPTVVKGWRIGQLLTSDLFGMNSERSPEIEDLVGKRDKLLAKKDRDEQEDIELENLDNQILAVPTLEKSDDQKLVDHINQLYDKLKNDGKIE